MTTQAETKTVVIETCNLEGEALDWSVGKAEGHKVDIADPQYGNGHRPFIILGMLHVRFRPSSDWTQAGDLVDAHIKRMGDCAEPANGWDDIPEGRQCFAITHDGEFVTGATKRIAVCRAVVLAKLGTSVEVPAVLVAQ